MKTQYLLAVIGCSFLFFFCASGAKANLSGEIMTFSNPLYIGADPWVIKDEGWYYHCWSTGRAIYVSRSHDFISRGESSAVWFAKPGKWNAANVWAPELHRIRGKWYIYYAADAGTNETHRMGVLVARSDDPLGEWDEGGQLYTGGRWAIDGTVLEYGKDLYFIWSGWPGYHDGKQNLYIARMDSPVSISEEPVLISEPTFDWEMNAMPIMEGPEILKNGSNTLIVYSASGSWTRFYCLGALVLKQDGKPDDPSSWIKIENPLFSESDTVYGPGHASFTVSKDGTTNWIVYHAKTGTEHGWNRVVRAQPFEWKNGLPVFGKPVPDGVELVLK